MPFASLPRCPANGKLGYTSKAKARKVTTHRSVKAKNIYKCPYCGLYHLTNRTQLKGKRNG